MLQQRPLSLTTVVGIGTASTPPPIVGSVLPYVRRLERRVWGETVLGRQAPSSVPPSSSVSRLCSLPRVSSCTRPRSSPSTHHAYWNSTSPHLKLLQEWRVGRRRGYSSTSSSSSEQKSQRGEQNRGSSSGSFIRQVLEQVKKDMATNEELRKAVEELQKAGKSPSSTSVSMKKKLEESSQKVAESFEVAGKKLREAKEKMEKVTDDASRLVDESPALRSAVEFVKGAGEEVKKAVGWSVDQTASLLEYLNDEKHSAKGRAEKWRQEKEARKRREEMKRRKMEEGEAKEKEGTEADGRDDDTTTAEEQAAHEELQYALILSQDSAWDRFGTKLRDMPFLQNFFENPMLGKLFGETEQAAAIREMKTLDPYFRLPELVELVEHVIAPHLVEAFLNADEEGLKLHCGEAAFAALQHSIRERKAAKLTLDPSILLLRNVDLKGATRMDDSSPWFIFTFSTQQINCMRDKKGDVVIGAVDDIREVLYSMAVAKHPEPEKEGVQYPWLVTEIAIVGNQPSW